MPIQSLVGHYAQMAGRGRPRAHTDREDFVLDIVLGLATGDPTMQKPHRVVSHLL
jgi:hypothetical protein